MDSNTFAKSMPQGFQDNSIDTSPLELKQPMSQTMADMSSQQQGTPDERLTH